MISKRTMAAIEARGWFYILGARPRATKEVREEVLTDGGAMTGIMVARAHDPEPLTLEIKEVVLPRPGEDGEEPKERRRYVVCRNPAEARRRRGDPGGDGRRSGGQAESGGQGADWQPRLPALSQDRGRGLPDRCRQGA